MDNNKKTGNKSRRWFLSLFATGSNDVSTDSKEKVKMLTADGKLVEVDKELLDKATTKFRASQKDIFNWMNNPSKENS
ncbi:MAG: hypothetical protein JNK14_06515 [Chitinophagaceae bacterium]|nr:hypothetical protein [Chitinophagaceae bacterium]